MLEIVQTGQAGKTSFLLDMHRLRKRVFADRMRWPVTITAGGLEVDQFDLPETVYLLALDADRRVIGNMRLLPTSGPTMIRDVWPQFMDSIDYPSDPLVWEGSRFAVDSIQGQTSEGIAQVNRATQEIFCGLAELCLQCGIEMIYTMHDMRIARLLKLLDCRALELSAELPIGGHNARVGAFRTDALMLKRLRAATGIIEPLILVDQLPPALRALQAAYQPATSRQLSPDLSVGV